MYIYICTYIIFIIIVIIIVDSYYYQLHICMYYDLLRKLLATWLQSNKFIGAPTIRWAAFPQPWEKNGTLRKTSKLFLFEKKHQ